MAHEPGSADEILIAETIEDVQGIPRRAQNPAVSDVGEGLVYGSTPPPAQAKRRSKKKSWSTDPTEMQLYNGYDGLLVRTALIRSPEWNKKTFKASGPEAIFEACEFLRHADQEHMVVFALDSQLRVSAIYEASKGTQSETIAEASDIAKVCILASCRGAIVVHNHPSGAAEPSKSDDVTTQKLCRALRCVGIRIYDHVIITARGFYSYASFNPAMLEG